MSKVIPNLIGMNFLEAEKKFNIVPKIMMEHLDANNLDVCEDCGIVLNSNDFAYYIGHAMCKKCCDS